MANLAATNRRFNTRVSWPTLFYTRLLFQISTNRIGFHHSSNGNNLEIIVKTQVRFNSGLSAAIRSTFIPQDSSRIVNVVPLIQYLATFSLMFELYQWA